MSISDHFRIELYATRIIEPFDELLTAAWAAPGKTPRDLTQLGIIKKAYRGEYGVGLSTPELAWLTGLARRAGWRPPASLRGCCNAQ